MKVLKDIKKVSKNKMDAGAKGKDAAEGMQFAAAERPHRPVPSNRGQLVHKKVEAMPNHIEATGTGHYDGDLDGNIKFHQHD